MAVRSVHFAPVCLHSSASFVPVRFFGDKSAFRLDVYFKTMNESKPVQRFFNFANLRKT